MLKLVVLARYMKKNVGEEESKNREIDGSSCKHSPLLFRDEENNKAQARGAGKNPECEKRRTRD